LKRSSGVEDKAGAKRKAKRIARREIGVGQE